MNGPPRLPQHVSANGAEIWDWAIALSHWEQRQEKIGRLRADIARVRCGNCSSWMTRGCPRERNVNGYSRGPSMNDTICSQYAEKPWSAELRDQRRAELAELLRDSDTRPKAGDPTQIGAPLASGAVREAQSPNPSHSSPHTLLEDEE